MARTGWTKSPSAAPPRSPSWTTGGHTPARSRRRMPACRAQPWPTSRAATPAHNAAALTRLLDGEARRLPRHRAAECRRRPYGGGTGKGCKRGRGHWRHRPWTAARRKANWKHLIQRIATHEHSRQNPRLQKRGSGRRQVQGRRAPSWKPAPRTPNPPRGFRAALEDKKDDRRIRPDRRDQEGQPVQGPDPRRFRSPRPGHGL